MCTYGEPEAGLKLCNLKNKTKQNKTKQKQKTQKNKTNKQTKKPLAIRMPNAKGLDASSCRDRTRKPIPQTFPTFYLILGMRVSRSDGTGKDCSYLQTTQSSTQKEKKPVKSTKELLEPISYQKFNIPKSVCLQILVANWPVDRILSITYANESQM